MNIVIREHLRMNENDALEMIQKLPYGLSNFIWEFVLPSTK